MKEKKDELIKQQQEGQGRASHAWTCHWEWEAPLLLLLLLLGRCDLRLAHHSELYFLLRERISNLEI